MRSPDRKRNMSTPDDLPLAYILDSIDEAVHIVDGEWNICYINQAAARLGGKNVQEMRGKNVWAEFPELAGSSLEDACRRALREQVRQDVEFYFARCGKWFEIHLRPTLETLTLYATEITRRVQAETHLEHLTEIASLNARLQRTVEDARAMNEALLISGMRQHRLAEETEELNLQLQALATTDGLTGLINHLTFHERLGEEVTRATRYATPLSVLFIDVDAFKGYNDSYGHPAGDSALRKIGEALQATGRANDLIARYGGEEFAIILPETGAAAATRAAERFRAAIEAICWQERKITISVGAATLSPTISDASSLLSEADKAVYRSKARGRNCVTHSMDAAPPTGDT